MQNISIIFDLFNNGYLDKFINNLNDQPIMINYCTFQNKNLLTSEEQFLQIIDNYITFFNKKFTFITLKELIIKLIFYNNDNKIFHSKKYIGNNKYINYFNKNYILFTIQIFYKNCKKLYTHLKSELDSININITEININNIAEANKILDILIDLCITNKNAYDLIYLFKDIDNAIVNVKTNEPTEKVKSSIYDIYIIQWKNIINNYHKNKAFLKELQIFTQNN